MPPTTFTFRTWAEFVGALFFLSLGVSLGYYAGRPKGDSAATVRARAAVVVAQAERAAIVPQVEAAAKEDHRATAAARPLRRQVIILHDSALRVQETPSAPPIDVPVPPLIVKRIRADSIELAAKAARIFKLEELVRADSNVIRSQAAEIIALRKQKEPACGRRCGIVIGILGTLGAALIVDKVADVFDGAPRPP